MVDSTYDAYDGMIRFQLKKLRSRVHRIANKKRRLLKNRLMKGWTWDGSEFPAQKIMNSSNNPVFLGASQPRDYMVSQLLIERATDMQETLTEEITILADIKAWVNRLVAAGLTVTQFSDEDGIAIERATMSFIAYEVSSNSIVIKVYGDSHFIRLWSKTIASNYEVVTNIIDWVYSNDGASVEIPLRPDKSPVDEMYPWLGDETLAEYYDRFMESDASILLLIGPPGTGKTTFIRGLLQHANQSAMVSYDANILSKDYVFASFVEGKMGLMVIEDADNFLSSRSEGNDMMHKFLNVGDGLVTTKNKKLIFSTNLPSIRDVDSALIRPGRCFDIITFSNLNKEQAQKLATRVGVELAGEKSEYSIAEVFFKQVQAPRSPKRKVGFV